MSVSLSNTQSQQHVRSVWTGCTVPDKPSGSLQKQHASHKHKFDATLFPSNYVAQPPLKQHIQRRACVKRALLN